MSTAPTLRAVIAGARGARLTVESSVADPQSVQLWAYVPAVAELADRSGSSCPNCLDPEQAGVSLDPEAVLALIGVLASRLDVADRHRVLRAL